MKTLILTFLGIFLSTILLGQPISVYFPYETHDPNKIDAAEVEYTSSPVTIVGVVSGESQGGHSGHKDYTTHHINLKAWKIKDSSTIQDKNLVVFRTVKKNRNFFKDVPKYSIVEFEVYLNKKETRAVLLKGHIIANPSTELLEAQKRLQEPQFLESPQYGAFKFNAEIQWYEKEMKWNSQSITVALQIDDQSKLTDHFDTLEQLFKHQKGWKQKVDAYAIQELLPLKNESWLEEREAKWSKEKFVSTYSLESIWISEDGHFEFWHRDGDIFYGHYIMISGSIEEGPTYADIPG